MVTAQNFDFIWETDPGVARGHLRALVCLVPGRLAACFKYLVLSDGLTLIQPSTTGDKLRCFQEVAVPRTRACPRGGDDLNPRLS